MLPMKEIKGVPGDFVIPSLSILNGAVVTVIGNRYSPLKIGSSVASPQAVAKELLDRYERVHVLDLKGIQKDAPQWDVIREVAELGPLWVDVGAATGDSVIDIIMAGAEVAILPLKFLESLDEVASALELTDNIAVQVDMEERILGPERVNRFRGLKELLEELAILGVRRIILHDHLNPPAPVEESLKREREDGSAVEIYWASKDIAEVEKAFKAGLSGALISLGDLLGGEDSGDAEKDN